MLLASLFLARPPVGWTPPDWKAKEAKIKAKINTSSVDMTPWQMLRQPSFYVIYVMMTMLAFGGLVVTAQLNPMASSYHVDKVVVAFGMTAVGVGHHGRPDTERSDPSLLGMGIGSHRPGECYFYRLHPGSVRGVRPAPIDRPSGLVRRVVGPLFLCVGQYFLVVPSITGDLVRKQVGNYRTMESSTPQKERPRPSPGRARPGSLPGPAPGQKSSGR